MGFCAPPRVLFFLSGWWRSSGDHRYVVGLWWKATHVDDGHVSIALLFIDVAFESIFKANELSSVLTNKYSNLLREKIVNLYLYYIMIIIFLKKLNSMSFTRWSNSTLYCELLWCNNVFTLYYNKQMIFLWGKIVFFFNWFIWYYKTNRGMMVC